ncbi:MAG: tetratricopeptide repeat protein [Bacteroidetes bacterium]|nr:tetratricopeptide repeat protein [Bacteroidota bacterium]
MSFPKVKIKLYIFFSIFLLQTFYAVNKSTAQGSYSTYGIDSAAIDGKIQADKARRDSIANAAKLKRQADSLARELAKIKMQQFRDSIVNARMAKRAADSLAREQVKLTLLQKKKTSDSLAADRIRIQDSTRLARKSRSDSLLLAKSQIARQKKLLEKYKNSKHYKDSIALVKKAKQDILNEARAVKLNEQKTKMQAVKDSMLSIRQFQNDSLKAIRKHISDSTKTAIETQKTDRKRVNDSLLAIRKQKSDSLSAARGNKAKKTDDTAKEKAEKQKKLALKIHEAKKEEWSNEKLLKRKWNIPRKVYQNTVTRYNYFYNANRKYQDAVKNLKKNHKDDYTKLISLYPYDVQKAGTSVAGEMDSVIKKSSFSTQIHDPRSKWFDNLYFLMGRASFVKNDFDGAIQTFQFIANEYKETPNKKKKKQKNVLDANKDGLSIATIENRKGLRILQHHPIRNQALLWLGKSYIQAQQYSEASALLSTLEKDKHFPKRYKSELFLTKASVEIEQSNYTDAISSLESSLQSKMKGAQKARTEFVLGQLYEQSGDYANSTKHYKQSISGKANPEMDFYTKLFIAQNAAKGGGDKQFAIHQLEKLIKDPKFEKFKSQAYNVLASIYDEEDPNKAIEILTKSVKSVDAKDPFQKAVAYELLGKIYYRLSDYEMAKLSYDSASVYGTNPALDNINEVNTRKTVLTDVVKNIRIIHRQDSLLALSQLSEKEQKAAAKKEAERLKKLEEVKEESTTEVVKLTPTGNVKSNWYFYNTAMMEKGSTEFKQKWGNRKLEDNWRRRTAGTALTNETSEEGGEEGEKLLVNGSQYETLLAEIPKTPQQKDKANYAIMNAYYDLGLIYYAQLLDYPHSVKTFDTMLVRYPTTTLKRQSYYTQYLNYTALKNEPQALKYQKLLSDEFGQTEFAKLANNPNYFNDLVNQQKAIDYYYDTTYLAYKDTQYNVALTRITYAQQAFKGKPIMAKFDLLEGVVYAASKEFEKCKVTLENVIKNYPSTPEQAKAQELLNFLKPGSTSIKPDTLSKVGSEIKEAKGKGVYFYNEKEEHLFMIYLSKVDSKTMNLKTDLSDFNIMKHESEELITGQNLFTLNEGVLTVSKFSNAVFAKIYYNDITKERTFMEGFDKSEYRVCLISTPNFNELLKTRDVIGYLSFYDKNYK